MYALLEFLVGLCGGTVLLVGVCVRLGALKSVESVLELARLLALFVQLHLCGSELFLNFFKILLHPVHDRAVLFEHARALHESLGGEDVSVREHCLILWVYGAAGYAVVEKLRVAGLQGGILLLEVLDLGQRVLVTLVHEHAELSVAVHFGNGRGCVRELWCCHFDIVFFGGDSGYKKNRVFFYGYMSKQAARRVRWGFVLRGAGPFFSREDFERKFKAHAVDMFVFEHGEQHFGFVRLEKKVRVEWWGRVMKALSIENGTVVEDVFPFEGGKKGEEAHARVKEFMEAFTQRRSDGVVPEAVLKMADVKVERESRSALEKRLRVAEGRIKELEERLADA